MKEELDYDATSRTLTFYRDIDYDYSDFSVKLHYFIIHDPDPILKLKEHIDARWRSLDDIEDLNWAGADLELVKVLRSEQSVHLLKEGC